MATFRHPIHYTARLVGGPYDGSTWAIEESTYKAGVLQYEEIPEGMSHSLTEFFNPKIGRYYAHPAFPDVWLSEEVLEAAKRKDQR